MIGSVLHTSQVLALVSSNACSINPNRAGCQTNSLYYAILGWVIVGVIVVLLVAELLIKLTSGKRGPLHRLVVVLARAFRRTRSSD
jgi:hypothetical protein